MGNSRGLREYWYALVGGAVMVGFAVWIQWTAMDLTRFSLFEYMVRDLGLLAWWQATGAPLVLGVLCIGFGIWGVRYAESQRLSMYVFGFGVPASILLYLFSHLAGFLSLWAAVSGLLIAWGRVRRARRAATTD